MPHGLHVLGLSPASPRTLPGQPAGLLAVMFLLVVEVPNKWVRWLTPHGLHAWVSLGRSSLFNFLSRSQGPAGDASRGPQGPAGVVFISIQFPLAGPGSCGGCLSRSTASCGGCVHVHASTCFIISSSSPFSPKAFKRFLQGL